MRSLALILCCLTLLAFVSGCDDDPARPRVTTTIDPVAVITTTDYATGALATVTLDTHEATSNVASIHSDAVVRVYGGLVYVVNRFLGDNIQILDPADGFSVVRQFSVGNGSDPHDIVVVNSGKAYVTRYNETGLWIVDPATGDHVGTIDLSAYDDGDGTPEMDQMAMAGGILYITLQRVDRTNIPWLPNSDSYVAMVDVAADTLLDSDALTVGIQAVTLAHRNPFSTLQVDDATGNLYVACVGQWGVTDAGVEWVAPGAMASQGTALSGAAAGGDITDVEIVSATRGYAIISDASFATSLLAFDPSTGAVIDTVYAPGTFSLQDAEASPAGELFVSDRDATMPGVRIYDAATGAALTAAPIDVGLPPFNFAFVE